MSRKQKPVKVNHALGRASAPTPARSRTRTRMLVLTGLSIALISAGAAVSVPFGPVPFTLQTMMVGIVVCLLPPVWSVAAVGGYLALGALGLPVFAGFRGGIGVLAGPTGGFLLGFFLASIIIALLRSNLSALACAGSGEGAPRYRWLVPLLDVGSLILLPLVYSALGCAWFVFVANATWETALLTCVLPFVLPDILKSIAAFTCVQPVRMALALQREAC